MAIPRLGRRDIGAPPKVKSRAEMKEEQDAIKNRDEQLKKFNTPPGFRGMAPPNFKGRTPGLTPGPGLTPKSKGKSKGRK